MMSAPRVSIILNVKNGAEFLGEAVESVLAQTFRDWELVAWDDCSRDGSAESIQRYRDDRIRYELSPEDTPLGPARNAAIARARGEWLAFLDQDDVWYSDKLERQLALLERGDCTRVGILYGRAIAFSDGSGGERDFDHRHEHSNLPQGRIFEALFRDSCFIAMSSAVLRREAVLAAGPIPPEYPTIADYFLYAAVARNYEARAVESPVCRYRVHGGNMSRHTRRIENEETLLLLDRFERDLPAPLVAWRRRVHWTLIAFDELAGGNLSQALRVLIECGSATYLLSRPAAIASRAVRRRLQVPRWKRQA